MPELLTAAQMRAIEQAAIASGEVTGLELMERAGRGVVEAILDWRPELATAPHRAVVLCGPGNNGGDGFVVARLLKERGWEVEVYLYGDETKLPPDAAESARRWREMGSVTTGLLETPAGAKVYDALTSCIFESEPDLCIDAIFGTGLTREVPHVISDLAQDSIRRGVGHLRGHTMSVVAVDVPSGLCSDSGRAFGCAIAADLTVSFHSAKIGHHIEDGPAHCGDLRVVSIGLE